MTFFSQLAQAKQPSGLSRQKKGLNLRLIIFFTLLTLVLTAVVIVAWEQLLRPPYYAWVASSYPGSENAEQRYKIEQRGEHFFISMTVDVIVVSILLALVNREHRRLIEAHDQLAHKEKIATLGQVAAQVAHEVRNPLAGLLLYSLHLKTKVAGVLPDSDVPPSAEARRMVNDAIEAGRQRAGDDDPGEGDGAGHDCRSGGPAPRE